MATSNLQLSLETAAGSKVTSGTVELQPYEDTYPTGALPMIHLGEGVWQRQAIPDGEYSLYYNGSLLTKYQRFWVGENDLSVILDHFDTTGDTKLKVSGLKFNTSHFTNVGEILNLKDKGIQPSKLADQLTEVDPDIDIPIYVGQLGYDINDETRIYVAVSKTEEPFWEELAEVDNSTLQKILGVLSIKNGGVNTAQLADGSVTQPKLDPSIVLGDASIERMPMPDLKLFQSIFVNHACDNNDADSPKITVTGIGATYIEVDFVPNVQEIVNAKQYEVFIFNTSSADAPNGIPGDYTKRAVLESADVSLNRIYIDNPTEFSVGDKIAISVHWRNVHFRPQIFTSTGQYSEADHPCAVYEHSDGNLRMIFAGYNVSDQRQLFLAKANDDVTAWTVLNSGDPVVPIESWYSPNIIMTQNLIREGDGETFIAAIFGGANPWQIGAIRFDEDLTDYNIYGPYSLPTPIGKSAPTGGYSNPIIFLVGDVFHLIVTARYGTAVEDMPNWRLEEYITTDQIDVSTEWTWLRTVFENPTGNDVSFLAGHIDSVYYMNYQGTPLLMVGSTTQWNYSGIKSFRSYGFLYFNGVEWIPDKRGAVFLAASKHLDLSTGTKYDNLTYLARHLGGYASIIHYKGINYFIFSSLAVTDEYHTGVSIVKSDFKFNSQADKPRNNSERIHIEVKSDDFALSELDNNKIFHVDTSGGTVNITLEEDFSDGFSCQIVNTGSNSITFTSSQAINAKSTLLINQWGGVMVYRNGADFYLIGDL